jgi:predicted nuclease of restriction endonuclease-like (RecB) superfamily
MNRLNSDDYRNLLLEVKQRIRCAQYAALRAVNKELITLYWDIGQLIVTRQQGETWGKSVVEQLAKDLQAEFPGISGFSARNIWRMREFYLTYHANEKLTPLVAEIGWTHNLVIMEKCKNDLEREFYLRMTRKFGWTKNVLIHQIENQTYEKTLLNQTNFEQTLPANIRDQAKLAVKDEYTFDFLELGDEHSERQLEQAILTKVEPFLQEMGGMFTLNKTIVEYALRESNKPIGVASYRIVSTVPQELKEQLPAPEQVAKLLEGVE